MKLKKILSLILVVAMTLSLFAGIPANKAEAADELSIELSTGSAKGMVIGNKKEDLKVSKVTLGSTAITYDDIDITLNDGSMDLDPDNKLTAGVNYSITIKLTVSNVAAFNNVKTAKISTYASSYDKTLADSVNGTVTVSGDIVTINAKIQAYPLLIGIEEIGKIAWDLNKGENVVKKATILDSKNVHFSASDITWYYTANRGTTTEIVSNASKVADGNTSYYIAKLTLTANMGYCFKEYTKDEIASLATTTDSYKITYGNNGKKTITLEISGIKPVESYGLTDDTVTEISFDTERRIPFTTGMKVADIRSRANLPTYVYLGFGQNIAIAEPISMNWTYFNAAGQSINDNTAVTDNTVIYACYPLASLEAELNRKGKKDTYRLLNYYRTDPTFSNQGILTSLRQTYWVIKIDISSSLATSVYSTPNTFTWDKVNNKYSVTTSAGTIAGTACIAYVQGGTLGTMTFGSTNTVSGNSVNGAGIYSAWGKANTNGASYLTYKYYDATMHSEVQNQNIAVYLPIVPATDMELYKSFIKYTYISGTDPANNDLLKALDLSKIWTVWTCNNGGFTFDNGVTKFAESTSYALNVYIPLKKGYKIYANTYQLNLTGYPATAGYAYTENDLLHMTFYLPIITEKTGFISTKGVNKKMYFKGFNAPIAGATVPKKLELTDASAKYGTFQSITWLEEGQNFNGSTFTLGKRYEAVVVINCMKGYISCDWATVRDLVGDPTYAITARADKIMQTIEIRYSFGICPTKKASKIGSISLSFENGTPLESFKTSLNEKKTVKVTFTDGSVENVEVKPGFKNGTTQYASFYDQLVETYTAAKAYDPNKKEAQYFVFYGNIDLTAYSGSNRNSVKIEIEVKAEDTCIVTFDANGGTYLGETTMKVGKGKPYGFGYDPNKIYREGYFFAGWYLDNGTNYDAVNRVWAASICKGSVTLYAHWLKTFTGMIPEVSAKSYSKGSLTFTWGGIKTLYNGFEVMISKGGTNWSEPEDVGLAKTKLFSGLASGKNYYVKVRAYRYDSTHKRVYGIWSKAVRVKTK